MVIFHSCVSLPQGILELWGKYRTSIETYLKTIGLDPGLKFTCNLDKEREWLSDKDWGSAPKLGSNPIPLECNMCPESKTMV